jgi:hypothetical protein
MSFLERLAEQRIREAMERGEFDALPRFGEPLRFESDALVPDDLKLAYKILRDGGFLPPEMELRREIATLEALLAEVEDGDERLRLARRINDKVLRLNLLRRTSIDRETREIYVRKLRERLTPYDHDQNRTG